MNIQASKRSQINKLTAIKFFFYSFDIKFTSLQIHIKSYDLQLWALLLLVWTWLLPALDWWSWPKRPLASLTKTKEIKQVWVNIPWPKESRLQNFALNSPRVTLKVKPF
jgi:hypothetical protein